MSCNDCNCCQRRLKAQSIVVADGVTTITVAPTTFSTCGSWCIALFSAIPVGTDCTRIVIASGSNTYEVVREDGNYYRPCELKCRSMLRLRFLDDPNHFLFCGVKGRR